MDRIKVNSKKGLSKEVYMDGGMDRLNDRCTGNTNWMGTFMGIV